MGEKYTFFLYTYAYRKKLAASKHRTRNSPTTSPMRYRYTNFECAKIN